MRRSLIQLAVAHAIRETSGDRLDRADQRLLDQLVAQIVPNGVRPPPKPNRKIKSGTRLLHEWQGKVHEVTVTATGFSWNDASYGSLSQIAKRDHRDALVWLDILWRVAKIVEVLDGENVSFVSVT